MTNGRRAKRYTDEQIVPILQEQVGGVTAAEVVRRHGFALDTRYRWKRKFSGVSQAEVRRLKVLEEENRRLKRVVAD